MKPLRTRTEERNRILNYQLDDNNPFSPAFPLALDSLILSLTPSMKTERVKHPIPNCPYVALQNNLTESYLCKEFLASCPCIGLSFLPHQTRGKAGRETWDAHHPPARWRPGPWIPAAHRIPRSGPSEMRPGVRVYLAPPRHHRFSEVHQAMPSGFLHILGALTFYLLFVRDLGYCYHHAWNSNTSNRETDTLSGC